MQFSAICRSHQRKRVCFEIRVNVQQIRPDWAVCIQLLGFNPMAMTGTSRCIWYVPKKVQNTQKVKANGFESTPECAEAVGGQCVVDYGKCVRHGYFVAIWQ